MELSTEDTNLLDGIAQVEWKVSQSTTFGNRRHVKMDGKQIFVIEHYLDTETERLTIDKLCESAPTLAKENQQLKERNKELLEALQGLHKTIMLSDDRKIFDNGVNADIVAKAQQAIQNNK
jgi:hypothetical protein